MFFKFRSKKVFIFLILICVFLVFCSGESSSNAAASALLLPKETGESGCTVAGLGTQLKAGYTGITTSSQTVKFEQVGTTHYAVNQLTGAQIGTRIVYSRFVKPTLFISTSCPLDMTTASVAKEGTEYTKSDSPTTITFTKAGSYLVYLYQTESPITDPLTVLTDGTPVKTDSDSDLTDILNGGTSKTFKFACDGVTTDLCQNYYGSLTSCLSGGNYQTAKCTEDGTVVGSCKVSQSSIGHIISVFYSGSYNTTTATAYCSGISGTYVDGTTVQSP
ncbi:hypothetical protein P3G55_11650 [Leptospira sp. 96542]|nr:hypothetical protein [Leptospira sp. 96542]